MPSAPLYFAYGSNLNLNRFLWRCPDAKPFGPLTLPGYRLVFDRVADIVPDRDSRVCGALYEITDACEEALDVYEGYPRLYDKRYFSVEITTKGERRVEEVMFYTMLTMELSAPNKIYVKTIRQGFDHWGIEHDTLNAAVAESRRFGRDRARRYSWEPTTGSAYGVASGKFDGAPYGSKR